MKHHNGLIALSALALVIPLVACASPGASTVHVAPRAVSLPVEGYLMAASGVESIVNRDAAGLALIGVDGINLTAGGNGLTAVPADAAPSVAASHAHGLKTELLMGNFDEAIGDFSPAIATRLFTSKTNRATVITSLVSTVSHGGFDGVQLDFESLDASHRAGLSAFTAELRAALPAAKSVSMALMAADTVAGYASEGYQLSALAKSAGRFVLMAYDQHGPTWTRAGPIGGTPWVKSVLHAFIATGVPKVRIDLGVAEYAYTWPADGTSGVQLSVAEARAKAGKGARFDTTQGEWNAVLADGTVLWWSDARTLAERKALAAASGVHGLAIWELSLGDPVT